MDFPKHHTLFLSHNEHKNNYETVAQAIDSQTHGYGEPDWVSEEQKAKAIATNECWILQWYPKTPVGFHILAAADLTVLLEVARNGDYA